jgi:valyl-tRNA synthetase
VVEKKLKMSEELSKVYEPKTVEPQVNQIWFSHLYFHAEPPTDGKGEKTYTIVIPPPNVTAPLHIGHALNNTLQDILIRFRRMQGYNTLWMPGTDHAGIATQTVVEKRILSEEGKRRTDFKREEFVARLQAWKDEYEAQIINQLKAMGCSCDWQRTRFTMDEVCAKAVRAAFFKLFKDGLIYRGKRLVNWDPATQTVLADDEVEYETVQGHFWYLRYPLVEPVQIEGKQIEYVTVATTRPETMLGDTAVAMNPTDARAKYLVGKKVRLPIVGRIIPIIADEHVVLPNANSENDNHGQDARATDEKARFSTGFLKVTPAHDPDDWEIGQRHGLEVINVMAPDGSISDKHGWSDWNEIKNPDVENLIGMDRFEAREAVVKWFRQENLLEDVREYAHEIGHSYRSHVPIEPYLSDQWYIAVKKPIEWHGLPARENTAKMAVPLNSLAGLALKPLLDGRLRFVPDRYARTYQTWLENLRDWPISRQLWWGHRIPMWSKLGGGGQLEYELSKFPDKVCSELTGSDEGPITYICVAPGNEDIEKQLADNGFKRDEDVLDTWFSSALWPFSTMGWPDETAELKAFYPGDVLCTAREIITLWVSRMVMMGQYCVGDIPFKDVYIHAMIQDGEGRKMSKSLGNGIDPLVVINSHGADAMRFTLASMTTQTQDIRMPVVLMTLPDGRQENTSPKFDVGRNFCNKLWNASRFAIMNLEGIDPAKFEPSRMDITDRWILSRLAKTISDVTQSLDEFNFSESLSALYKFFWNDFCDWYLEWIKPRMQNGENKPIAQNVLAFVLDQTLRLLHPFVPFITEGIFQKLNEIAPYRGLTGIADVECAKALVIAEWPNALESLVNEDIEKQISLVQIPVRAYRDMKNKYGISNSVLVSASANVSAEVADVLAANSDLICRLACLKDFKVGADIRKPSGAAVSVVEGMSFYMHDTVDLQTERTRFEKQRQETEKAKKAVEAKLANKDFLSKAKPQVVAQAKEKLDELSEQLETIEKHLLELND